MTSTLSGRLNFKVWPQHPTAVWVWRSKRWTRSCTYWRVVKAKGILKLLICTNKNWSALAIMWISAFRSIEDPGMSWRLWISAWDFILCTHWQHVIWMAIMKNYKKLEIFGYIKDALGLFLMFMFCICSCICLDWFILILLIAINC